VARPIRLRAADLDVPAIGADEDDEVIHRRCERSAVIHLRHPRRIDLGWTGKNRACSCAC
jgi:hypothetical protein